ncbi:MAG: putative metal-dependent hydrolase [Saprospiraceae bacterium]
MEIEKFKYPIGKFKTSDKNSVLERTTFIKNIEVLPQKMRKAVEGLNDVHLDTPYRPDGWTIRQVVHHVADSHINSYVRFKWAMTENVPFIKAYQEKDWAKQPDALKGDVTLSLHLLDALHARWTYFLKEMSDNDFKRQLQHPDWARKLSLNIMCAMYSWHSLHHTAHITELRKRKGWV